MDQQLKEDMQHPLYTPFCPSKLLKNMQVELDVFNLDFFFCYLSSLTWPYMPLDQQIVE
jgi:hypothetical protein